MQSITLKAPAKINLCLSVLGRRPDGYHDVEMLMQMVGLYDEVTVAAHNGIGVRFSCDSDAIPPGEDNIAWKAGHALLKRAGREAGITITIRKAIPVAAGLGGGSSDAAAVLAAANEVLGIGLNREQLAGIGAKLGMDVPFFFYGPTALAQGRGERLTELTPLPKLQILLVNPGFETSTAWVYKNLNLRLTKKVDCNKILRLAVRNIASGLHNDLETVTAAAHPVIHRIRQSLLEQGAAGVLMSGSGPTVFGIFETGTGCMTAAENLSNRGWKLFPTETLVASPLSGHIRQ
jgi:4-diphosphocytidyl-2-C-methyl-D-erythritol kinase